MVYFWVQNKIKKKIEKKIFEGGGHFFWIEDFALEADFPYLTNVKMTIFKNGSRKMFFADFVLDHN